MPKHDYLVSKAKLTMRKQESLPLHSEISKPVFIVTSNPSDSHINELIEELERNHVSFQLQHGASTLGFALDQRFFVVVDNRYDDVMLGPEFASKLITIVGYPKLGANKKNTYFRTPEEVLKYYYDFKYNEDQARRTEQLIRLRADEPIPERMYGSREKPRIQLKSIHKYSDDLDKAKHTAKRKLVIMEDKQDVVYTAYVIKLKQERQRNGVDIITVNNKTTLCNELNKKSEARMFALVNFIDASKVINYIKTGSVIIVCLKTNRPPTLEQEGFSLINNTRAHAVVYSEEDANETLDKLGFNKPKTNEGKVFSDYDMAAAQPRFNNKKEDNDNGCHTPTKSNLKKSERTNKLSQSQQGQNVPVSPSKSTHAIEYLNGQKQIIPEVSYCEESSSYLMDTFNGKETSTLQLFQPGATPTLAFTQYFKSDYSSEYNGDYYDQPHSKKRKLRRKNNSFSANFEENDTKMTYSALGFKDKNNNNVLQLPEFEGRSKSKSIGEDCENFDGMISPPKSSSKSPLSPLKCLKPLMKKPPETVLLGTSNEQQSMRPEVAQLEGIIYKDFNPRIKEIVQELCQIKPLPSSNYYYMRELSVAMQKLRQRGEHQRPVLIAVFTEEEEVQKVVDVYKTYDKECENSHFGKICLEVVSLGEKTSSRLAEMGDATIVIRTIDRGLSVKDCSAEILKGSSEKNGKTKFALR